MQNSPASVIPALVHMRILAIIPSANHVEAEQCIKSCSYKSGASDNVHINHQNWTNCDLSHFVMVDISWAGLSISEMQF